MLVAWVVYGSHLAQVFRSTTCTPTWSAMHSQRVTYHPGDTQRYPDYGTWECQHCHFDDNIYYWSRCNMCNKPPYFKKLPTPGTRRIVTQDGIRTKVAPPDPSRRRRWRNLVAPAPVRRDGGVRTAHTPDRRATAHSRDDSPEKLIAGLQHYLSPHLMAQAQAEIERNTQEKKSSREALLAQNNGK